MPSTFYFRANDLTSLFCTMYINYQAAEYNNSYLKIMFRNNISCLAYKYISTSMCSSTREQLYSLADICYNMTTLYENYPNVQLKVTSAELCIIRGPKSQKEKSTLNYILIFQQDGQFKVDWASQAYCNFTIFVAVVMFVISLVQFWRFVKFFRRGRDSRWIVDLIKIKELFRLVQTAAVTRASAETACIWRRRLQKIRKIPFMKKNYAASCDRKKNSQFAAAVWMSLY